MKCKKRGAVEIQFNWIFILLAGAVILLFFGTIIAKQRTASEQKLSASLLVDLESIITGSIVSKQSLNYVPIPNKEINFENCDFYYIGKEKEASTKTKKDIKERVIFAPDLIKGTRLTMWTLPWDIPYRVTNFLYLTSPQVRYVFVYDSMDTTASEFADSIESLLPPETLIIDEEEYNVMFRQENPGTLVDLNNYKVKFVLIDINPTSLSLNNFKTKDISAVKVESTEPSVEGKLNYGELKFYKKTDGGWSPSVNFEYYGKASLIGAIFAENWEMYECAMQNAFRRMRVVTDVYIKRTKSIRDDPDTSMDCSTYYGGPLDNLDLILSASGDFNQANVDTIKSAGDNLLSQNKNCPLVY